MMTLLLITACLGIGIFIGMVLSAAFSSDRDEDVPRVTRVYPYKSCYHCLHLQQGRVDEAT